MNWYAYKLLADGYAADRQRIAETHRRARAEARRAAAAGIDGTDTARAGWRRSPLRNRIRPDA